MMLVGPTTHQGARGLWHALVPSGPHRLAPMCSFGSVGVFCLKKSPKSFVAFGLCLVLISCKVKNKKKIATTTRN